MPTTTLAVEDQAVERELAQLAESFRFVLDVTPVNAEEQRVAFLSGAVRFIDVFTTLVGHGFSRRSAYTTTMRVFRSGGLTKDAIYLRGLINLLMHLRDGGSLDLLWLGKLSLEDLPVVEDLYSRGVLSRPKLVPHYVAKPATSTRLAEAAALTDLSTLVGARA